MIKQVLTSSKAVDYLKFLQKMLRLQKIDSELAGHALQVRNASISRTLLKFGFHFISFDVHGTDFYVKSKTGVELLIVSNNRPECYTIFVQTISNFKSITYHIDNCRTVFKRIIDNLQNYTDTKILVDEWRGNLDIISSVELNISSIAGILKDLGSKEIDIDLYQYEDCLLLTKIGQHLSVEYVGVADA